MLCYLPPCDFMVTVGSITLLLRKETAVNVHRFCIVTSVITFRQAERNEEKRVKEIYKHTDIYILFPNHPAAEKFFQVSEILFHHNYVDKIKVFRYVKPCRQFTGVLWDPQYLHL